MRAAVKVFAILGISAYIAMIFVVAYKGAVAVDTFNKSFHPEENYEGR